jgi:hypothetical protein
MSIVIPAGKGFWSLVYQSDGLTKVMTYPITCGGQILDQVAQNLDKEYGPTNRILNDPTNGRAEYLIAGVLVRTSRIHSPHSENEPNVDQISFHSEIRLNLELVANQVMGTSGDIAEKHFRREVWPNI